MDETLDRLLKTKERPFHDRTIFSEDISIGDLLNIVQSTVRHVELYYKASTLFRFDDWLQHDGYVSQRRATSMADLQRELLSVSSMYEARPGDDLVWTAIYPESCDFLLRYYVREINETSDPIERTSGAFSFTGFGFDLLEITKRCQKASVRIEPSERFFAERQC